MVYLVSNKWCACNGIVLNEILHFNWSIYVIAVAMMLPQTILSLLATTTTTTIPIYFDSTNHLHRDLHYHPEQPERISSCVQALDKARQENPDLKKMIQLIDVATDTSSPYSVQANHQPFSDDELAHAKDILLQIHSKDMVLKLEERCQKSKEQRIQDGKPALGHMGYIDFDTYLTTETFDVCLRATAAWIRAASYTTTDNHESTNTSGDFMAIALTRPPGHHATRSNQNGFCLFNFAAAAVAHILAQNPNAKVSVLDWDVHYGQGVADILQDESRARYVSIHQTPAFPYTGEKLQVQGPHQNILTIPMPAETTWTCGYIGLFEKALEFMCRHGEWEPDAIIICAGYDALDSDELASVSLNASDFGRMTSKLIQHLNNSTFKRPRIVFGLEGGYQLGPFAGGGNLQDAVIETVRAMVENKRPEVQ